MCCRPLRFACAVVALGTALFAASPAAAQGRASPDASSWLLADTTSHTVTFALLAGMNGANAGMNFNGFANGDVVLRVPPGWQLTTEFHNRDRGQNHGFDLIRYVQPVPPGHGSLAVAEATTDTLDAGLPPGATKTLRFAAPPSGRYIIRCTAGGHASLGMWILLDVDSTIALPALTTTKGKGR